MFKYYSPIGFAYVFTQSINVLDLNWNSNSENCFKFEKNKIKNDETNIFIINHHPGNIEFFNKNILPYIKYKFIIISFYGDSTFPNECNGWSELEILERGNNYNSIINSKFFIHWFSINKIIKDDEKFTSIPYGLDYWQMLNRSCFGCPIRSAKEQDDVLCEITENSLHFSKRIPKIYANWHLNITDIRNGNYRCHLKTILPDNIIYYDCHKSRDDYWKECSKYAFVVSPHGNGLDCIRTWEALSLGCIVIVKKSQIDNLYEDLPVLILNEWQDLTEELLYKTLDIFSKKKINMEKIKMQYWLNKVSEKL